MRLGEALVLAREVDNLIPEVLPEMRPNSVPYAFRLADINCRVARLRIDARKELDTRALCLVTGQNAVEFASGSRNRLTVPVRQFRGSKPLGIAINEKDLDGRARHVRNPHNEM